MNSQEQERQKESAREMLARSTSSEQRVKAIELEIDAYFARNPKAQSHDTYARHYLHANAATLPGDAVRVLQSKYGRPNRPKIAMGGTDWQS